jgi:glutamine amidotransferase
MITIIDYNLGNLGSIKNMIDFLGYENVQISSDHERILKSSHLILPGVGSFDEGMLNLTSLQLDRVIKNYVLNLKRPLLGICLGMQLLGCTSEEGTKTGLSLINFDNVKFKV